MDPITALVLASLATWGTFGSGIKDTAAILKGQTPPSHAYRMAKMEARNAQQATKNKRQVIKKPLHRRITLADLAVHWWEDGLEAADHWRANRHLGRAARKAKRKEFLATKKAQVKRGYALIKERGQKRFAPAEETAPPAQTSAQTGPQQGAPVQDGPPPGAGDNVVPLRPRTAHTTTDREMPVELLLGDQATYTAHKQGLDQYHSYYIEIADRLEQITNRAQAQQMSEATVQLGMAAKEKCLETVAKAAAARTHLTQAHESVAEHRQTSGTKVDADYVNPT